MNDVGLYRIDSLLGRVIELESEGVGCLSMNIAALNAGLNLNFFVL